MKKKKVESIRFGKVVHPQRLRWLCFSKMLEDVMGRNLIHYN